MFKSAYSLFFVLASLLPAQALAAAGEIFYTEGRVQVKRGDQQADAGRGYTLEAGDIVLTGVGSQARMRFNDESYFALPSNSTFKIDQFSISAAGRKRTPATAVFSLLRGGLRTVSGLIGSWSKDTYRVSTPVVTMGIRGTEYSVLHCDNSCENGAPNGGFIEVLGGRVNAANPAGGIDLEQGQWGEVRNDVRAAVGRLIHVGLVRTQGGGIPAPRQVFLRPAAFGLDKSGVFDPKKSILRTAGDLLDLNLNPEIRIEVDIEEPASPSAPSP